MDEEKKQNPDPDGRPDASPEKPDATESARPGEEAGGEATAESELEPEAKPSKAVRKKPPSRPVAKPKGEPEPEASASDESGQDEEAEPAKAAPEPTAKPAPKPSAARKPPLRRPVKGPTYEDLDESDELLADLQERFPEAGISGQVFLDQPIYNVPFNALFDVLIHLRDDPRWNFDYLVDLTALDYLGDELRFCLVYHLYSYPDGPLIRVKSRLEAGEVAPSVTPIWKTADWLEREVYDMFGIEFSGHPDLKRILLPEDWHGYPLRKDYDIKLQDQSWIRKHLRIRKVPN